MRDVYKNLVAKVEGKRPLERSSRVIDGRIILKMSLHR